MTFWGQNVPYRRRTATSSHDTAGVQIARLTMAAGTQSSSGLALHRWRIRIFDLCPMRRAAHLASSRKVLEINYELWGFHQLRSIATMLGYPLARRRQFMANVPKLIFGAAMAAVSIANSALAAHRGKPISAYQNRNVTPSRASGGYNCAPTTSCPGLPSCDPCSGISYPRGEPGGSG